MIRPGDSVELSDGGKKATALVLMASENGRSLMLTFEDVMIDGCIDAMPVMGMTAGGPWVNVVTGHRVEVLEATA